jgi:hypothetical protein
MSAQLPLSDDEIRECYVISDQLIQYIRDLHATARQHMLEGYVNSAANRNHPTNSERRL